ncbi:MAG TPA: hypothetical protein VFE16_13725 [Candidatus Cybelea sp.]|jgi:hypothetical protein|nr:hypothetical protein [Candidatus Cybelea sp.]
MAESLSDTLRDAAAALMTLPESALLSAFNDILRKLFPGLHVESAAIKDGAGSQTPVFQTVLSTEPISGGVANADDVICAVYVCEMLDESKLGEAFDRIAEVKSLKRKPPKKAAETTVIVGMIAATRFSGSLSKLADQVKTLTAGLPHNRHADMISVLSRGVIGYSIRFSGDRSLMERLPAQDEQRKWASPTLTHLVSTSTTLYALNKFVYYVNGQVAFVAPDKTIPEALAILEGVTMLQNILATYQETLSGKLVEIEEVAPIEQPPYTVESDKGELLLRLYYQSWQDGGIIHSEGKLPLEGLLPLMQVGSTMIFRPAPDRQVSAVLPMTFDDFKKAVEQIQTRCNLIVKIPQPKFTVGQVLGEGTSAPFVARLWQGLPNMRDIIIADPSVKAQFDAMYQAVLGDLTTLRRIGKETIDLWKNHAANVASGKIARPKGKLIEVDDLIHERLNHGIEIIVATVYGALKQVQFITKLLGIETGFMHQEPSKFEAGVIALEANDPALSDYLREARRWMNPVADLRNAFEHGFYIAPQIGYDRTGNGGIKAIETPIMGIPLTHFIPTLVSRANRYVEDVLMWCYRCTAPFPITEIPINQRDPSKPERFRFAFNPEEPSWIIIYSDDEFDRV